MLGVFALNTCPPSLSFVRASHAFPAIVWLLPHAFTEVVWIQQTLACSRATLLLSVTTHAFLAFAKWTCGTTTLPCCQCIFAASMCCRFLILAMHVSHETCVFRMKRVYLEIYTQTNHHTDTATCQILAIVDGWSAFHVKHLPSRIMQTQWSKHWHNFGTTLAPWRLSTLAP